jgi:hypothetical protein
MLNTLISGKVSQERETFVSLSSATLHIVICPLRPLRSTTHRSNRHKRIQSSEAATPFSFESYVHLSEDLRLHNHVTMRLAWKLQVLYSLPPQAKQWNSQTSLTPEYHALLQYTTITLSYRSTTMSIASISTTDHPYALTGTWTQPSNSNTQHRSV